LAGTKNPGRRASIGPIAGIVDVPYFYRQEVTIAFDSRFDDGLHCGLNSLFSTVKGPHKGYSSKGHTTTKLEFDAGKLILPLS